MVIGVNVYREICTLHLAGQVLVDKKLVIKLTNTAAEKAKKIVEKVKESLARDEEKRKSGAGRGFAAALQESSIMQNKAARTEFDFSKVGREAKAFLKHSPTFEEVPSKVISGENKIEVIPETMESIDSDDDNDLEITAEKSREEVMNDKVTEHIDLDDSEEEETVTLNSV